MQYCFQPRISDSARKTWAIKCTKSLISLNCIATKAQQISDVFEIFCLKKNTSITLNVQNVRSKKLKLRRF